MKKKKLSLVTMEIMSKGILGAAMLIGGLFDLRIDLIGNMPGETLIRMISLFFSSAALLIMIVEMLLERNDKFETIDELAREHYCRADAAVGKLLIFMLLAALVFLIGSQDKITQIRTAHVIILTGLIYLYHTAAFIWLERRS